LGNLTDVGIENNILDLLTAPNGIEVSECQIMFHHPKMKSIGKTPQT